MRRKTLPHPSSKEFVQLVDHVRDMDTIDALRAQLDYSATELCQRAGISNATYSRAIHLKKPLSPPVLRRLRSALFAITHERMRELAP